MTTYILKFTKAKQTAVFLLSFFADVNIYPIILGVRVSGDCHRSTNTIKRSGSNVSAAFKGRPLAPPLHDHALRLQLVAPFLFPRAFPVDAQAHVPLGLQRQQLLEQLLHVAVGFGRRLGEGALPGGGLGLPRLRLHLPLGRLVALVAHEHDGNGFHAAFDGQDLQRSNKFKQAL